MPHRAVWSQQRQRDVSVITCLLSLKGSRRWACDRDTVVNRGVNDIDSPALLLGSAYAKSLDHSGLRVGIIR